MGQLSMRILILLLMLVASDAFAQKPVLRKSKSTMHQWDRYVRGFRREHNFSQIVGLSSGTWLVRRFGTIKDKEFRRRGLFSKFRYAYHLRIHSGFGYILGSSAGYHFESTKRQSDFKPASGYMLPGLLVGLVNNISPSHRIGAGFEYYLERHDDIQERDGPDDTDYDISVNVQTADASVFYDFFYHVAWAFRLQGHWRYIEYHRPRITERINRDELDSSFAKRDYFVGFGVLHHLI